MKKNFIHRFLHDFSDFADDEVSISMRILSGLAKILIFPFGNPQNQIFDLLQRSQSNKKIVIFCNIPKKYENNFANSFPEATILFTSTFGARKILKSKLLVRAKIDVDTVVLWRSYGKFFLYRLSTDLGIKVIRCLKGLDAEIIPYAEQLDVFNFETLLDKRDIRISPNKFLQKKESKFDILSDLAAAQKSSNLYRIFRLWEPIGNKNSKASTASSNKILVIGKDKRKGFGQFRLGRELDTCSFMQRYCKDLDNREIYYWPNYDSRKVVRRLLETYNLENTPIKILNSTNEMLDYLSVVDEVFATGSDLTAAAVLAGKPVICDGKFSRYELKRPRKDKRVVIDVDGELANELITSLFLKGKKYLHPFDGSILTFYELSEYLAVHKAKQEGLFEVNAGRFDVDALGKAYESQSNAWQLLVYLHKSKGISKANPLDMVRYAQTVIDLRDFELCCGLLIETSNYDALVAYCKAVISLLAQKSIVKQLDTAFVARVLSQIAVCLKNANGRVIPEIPPFEEKLELLDLHQIPAQEFVYELLRCYSYNIQYDELRKLITFLTNVESPPVELLKKIANILGARPTRSERGSEYRSALLFDVSTMLADQQNVVNSGYANRLLSEIIFNCNLKETEIVVSKYNELKKFIPDGTLLSVIKKPSSVVFLIKRHKDFATLYAYLLKNREVLEAKDFIRRVSFIKTRKHNRLWLHYYSYVSENKKLISLFESLSEKEQNADVNLGLYARALRNLGQFDLAAATYSQQLVHSKTEEKRQASKNAGDICRFLEGSSKILNSYPQPKYPRGVVILASQNCYNTLAMMVPSLLELKKKGYAIVNVTEGLLKHQPVGIAEIDQFSDMLPANLFQMKPINDWHISWENKEVISNGINFYQGFYERLSTAHRKYHVDLNDYLMGQDFNAQIRRADASLDICEKIFKELVLKQNIPVVFVSGNTHVTPFSVFRDFCRHKDHKKLGFINANIAYENYFSNLQGKYANTMCVTDMTLHREIRAPFLARKDQFENWYAKNKEVSQFKEQAQALVQVNRNNSTSSETEMNLVSYLKECKVSGKKIICAFGKIPVDLNVPYDGGPGHSDMADWLNHTIALMKSNQDTILLIKPHPHELRPEIALDLVERFEDLISVEMHENVRFLGHREINVHALAPYLDLAVMWNGSSSLELTLLGVPVIMCSYFGKFDYPIELHYPTDRQDYELKLSKVDFVAPDKYLRERAAYLMCFMGTEEISILNQYSYRAVTNDKVGVPRWNDELIQRFMEFGDPAMELASERIIEKIKNTSVPTKHIELEKSIK